MLWEIGTGNAKKTSDGYEASYVGNTSMNTADLGDDKVSFPRPRVVVSIFLGPFAHAETYRAIGFILLFSGPIFLLLYHLSPDFPPTIVDAAPKIFITAFVTLALATVTLRWYRRRGELRQSEHYLVLVGIAALTSLVVGLSNYLIYVSDPHTFIVRDELRKIIVAQYVNDQEARLADSVRIVKITNDLAAGIAALPGDVLQANRTSTDYFVNWTFTLKTARTQTNLILNEHEMSALGHTPILSWELEGRDGGDDIYLMPVEDVPGLSSELPQEEGQSVTSLKLKKAVLLSALNAWARKMRNEWVEPTRRALARANDAPVPLRYFLWEAALETFEAQPDYFTPVGPVASSLALAYAAAKFVFFGLFVGLLGVGHPISRSD